jgi:hypothetical protein
LKVRAAIEYIEEVQTLMMPSGNKSIKTPRQLTLALRAAPSKFTCFALSSLRKANSTFARAILSAAPGSPA